jgi:YVTN family beta-propeller protein
MYQCDKSHHELCVFSLFYMLVSISSIIIILSSLFSSDYGFFKAAQAHSVTIPIRGHLPFGIAYNSANNNMYVANFGSSTVSVISGSTDSVIASILVGRLPHSIAYVPPHSNKLYVTNEGSDDVYVINGATNRVIKNIPVGDRPWGIAYNPSTNNVYVANFANGTVSVINTSNDTLISTITLPNISSPSQRPSLHYLTYASSNQGIYVSGLRQVSAINTASNADVKDSIFPPSGPGMPPFGVAYNSNNNRVYVTGFASSGMVFTLNPDTNNFEGSGIPVGSAPYGIVYNPTNKNMYVTNALSNTISVINRTNSVIATIPTGSLPIGIAYNPNNGHIYVTNALSNTTSVIHS